MECWYFSAQAHQRGMDRRIIAQLFDCIDAISQFGRRTNDDNTPAATSEETAGVPLVTTVEALDGTDDASPSREAKDASMKKLVVLVVATNKWVLSFSFLLSR